ncbi:hypothetical protein BD779DRAFT_1545165 [Infundibulicybe gibba]|nr:hypothetical protein BD779DRAFT_1545165 [Infundibulicybe gibba]
MTGEIERSILKVVKDILLFVIAFTCCGIGAIGMIYLWWKWSTNYVWLVNGIFLWIIHLNWEFIL